MQVVDDDHVEAALAFQAPGTRCELGNGDAAGVVDVERQRLHALGDGGQLGELILVDVAAADVGRRHFRLLGKDTRRQLFGRHFKAEEADDTAVDGLQRAIRLLSRLVGIGDVEGDVGDQRRLAHGGTRGKDDQV